MKRRFALLLLAVLAWPVAGASAQVPGKCTAAVSERTGEVGCYHIASTPLPALPRAAVYWHLLRFPDLQAAQAAAQGEATATAFASHGIAWLSAIAPKAWHPRDRRGLRAARVGPLPVEAGGLYTARYMEAITPPGMRAAVHVHAGPEAFYVLSGKQCVQTPAGDTTTAAGGTAVTPANTPMTLAASGDAMRRVVVLVLHATDRPWMTMVDWSPAHACAAA